MRRRRVVPAVALCALLGLWLVGKLLAPPPYVTELTYRQQLDGGIEQVHVLQGSVLGFEVQGCGYYAQLYSYYLLPGENLLPPERLSVGDLRGYEQGRSLAWKVRELGRWSGGEPKSPAWSLQVTLEDGTSYERSGDGPPPEKLDAILELFPDPPPVE